MSMFERDIQVDIAPGPAAFSANGNGPDHAQEGEVRASDVDPAEWPALVWIAGAPPAAILILAATGAAFALMFLGIAKAMKGDSGVAG